MHVHAIKYAICVKSIMSKLCFKRRSYHGDVSFHIVNLPFLRSHTQNLTLLQGII